MPATPQTGSLDAAVSVTGLLPYRRLLAVCAHPDDETFGLGALIGTFVDAGATVDVLCLTHGEGSTLGAGEDLGARRGHELGCAAQVLGVERVILGEHPDGQLDEVPTGRLAAEVVAAMADVDALLVFDHGGITGHPDHQRATDAALLAARRLGVPVLAWAIPDSVASVLNAEFGAGFVGRASRELTHRVTVDRTRQLAAMTCHGSQLQDNPVPRRRIELQGSAEYLRELSAGGTDAGQAPAVPV
jgi:N-acetylglucosamine malate deacetylase 2